MPVHKGIKVAAVNRKARHDYFIEDTLECGIALTGTEVKSIRKGRPDFGVALFHDGAVKIYCNCHFVLIDVSFLSPYELLLYVP